MNTPSEASAEPMAECRACGDELPRSELIDGVCDECAYDAAVDDDQDWGAHEHG